jgi:hypothetical protein
MNNLTPDHQTMLATWRTRRAKSGARATEPTTHTSTLDNVNRKETRR